MTTRTCPAGHTTEEADYCDTCGLPLDSPASASSPAASGTAAPDAPSGPGGVPPESAAPEGGGSAPSARECPNCSTANRPDALFCEACGYDFTTGAMPRASAPAPAASAPAASQPGAPDTSPTGTGAPETTGADWVAEVWVDPAWYEEQGSEDPCPSPGLPTVVPLTARSMLIGRPSKSRSIHPDIDGSSDVGISRRQAQLTTDGRRWFVEDLQSSNGTYVAPASAPLPKEPIEPGQRRELDEDDRIYLGAWTRIVVRRATEEEKAGQA